MLCVDFTYLKPGTALVEVLNILLDVNLMPTGPLFVIMKGSLTMRLTFIII